MINYHVTFDFGANKKRFRVMQMRKNGVQYQRSAKRQTLSQIVNGRLIWCLELFVKSEFDSVWFDANLNMTHDNRIGSDRLHYSDVLIKNLDEVGS